MIGIPIRFYARLYRICDYTEIITNYKGIQHLLQIIKYYMSLRKLWCGGGMFMHMKMHLTLMGFALRYSGVV